MRDLISKKTRNIFREYLVSWTLREIEMEFEAADIPFDSDYDPGLSGARRTLVEQYYHSLDLSDPTDSRKLLDAFENILITAETKQQRDPDEDISHLVRCLERDGFSYESGRIVSNIPELQITPAVRDSARLISKETKADIFDAIRVEGIIWSGRLPETEFLSRLYDLEKLPSKDRRYSTSYTDIKQHRETNPLDWPDDWVFSDDRFSLYASTDVQFINFLCLMVHPVVRPNTQEADHLVTMFNRFLSRDGWEIVKRSQISDKPVFSGRRLIFGRSPALGAAKYVADVLDADYITRQITRMESAIEKDPELAIGTAKEFLETICKTILSDCDIPVPANASLPDLVKLVRKELQLLPDDIAEKVKGADTIKRLLSNLGTVAQNLSELRSLYGTGHGKGSATKGLQPRHARLAVGAASTLGVYLFEAYEFKVQKKK